MRREDSEKFRNALEDLESHNLSVRIAAIEILGSLDSKESLRFLLRCLHDESWHLRNHTAKILGIRGKKIIPYLKDVIQDGLWYARASSAKTLGEIGEVEGLDILIPLLEDERPVVRKEAQVALSKIISKDPSKVFNGYLDSKDPSFVRNFLERLKHVDPNGYELLFQILRTEKEGN